MEYGKLGTTGLDISRICLGAMSFGDSSRGGHPWVLGPDAARPLIKQAVEAGITFFDTANVYSGGSSEEILGAALKEYTDRDTIVLATKVHGQMRAAQMAVASRVRRYSPRSTIRCAGSESTTWTCCRSTGGIRELRSRRRSRLCTTS